MTKQDNVESPQPPYAHQKQSTEFIKEHLRVIDASDPGTGKTRSSLDAVKDLPGKTLVLAPLSILDASWGDDIEKFTPNQKYSIALAKNRAKQFALDADIYITNHDAVKWIRQQLKEDKHFLDGYNNLLVDECTAFKNRTSDRSRALLYVAERFENIVMMSGSLNSNGVLDVWHPTYVLDMGKRLGNFFQFRSAMCEPVQTGPQPQMREWREKPEAVMITAGLLQDITIRHEADKCLDIPRNSPRTVYTKLPPKILKDYYKLLEQSILETEDGVINAIHAGARTKKILQMLTGAVYDEFGNVHKIYGDRYELVMQLVRERDHSLVAFNWKHERDELIKLAESTKNPVKYAVIDGDVKLADRTEIVRDFQDGKYQVLFAHPQSAGHGLTLTKARTTIWSSPTYIAEHYVQFNKRIDRISQKHKTETIRIAAAGTKEEEVYDILGSKIARMEDLLAILTTPQETKK
jgi:SNF2 family DNA or RNA helicase